MEQASPRVVVETFAERHAEMESLLADRVAVVLGIVRAGQDVTAAAAHLEAFLTGQVLPYAKAEEEVLYVAAARTDAGRLLAAAMLIDHEALARLVDELATARDPFETATTARAIRELFDLHVRKEDELLLPALAADPTLDLAVLAEEQQARFAARHGGG